MAVRPAAAAAAAPVGTAGAPAAVGTATASAVPQQNRATAAPPAAAGRIITAGMWQSCGGSGDICPKALADSGGCKDEAWQGYRCVEGLSCERQHQWFWSCKPASRR
ncbi:hypothetical protein COO60DRAFT_1636426 [Scenedesmus sp. NREL 46B-D3]|nr:hypothetical protein COO60DRAFT_1636426 [Scenedesmus sp. NREL 46B-D3]